MVWPGAGGHAAAVSGGQGASARSAGARAKVVDGHREWPGSGSGLGVCIAHRQTRGTHGCVCVCVCVTCGDDGGRSRGGDGDGCRCCCRRFRREGPPSGEVLRRGGRERCRRRQTEMQEGSRQRRRRGADRDARGGAWRRRRAAEAAGRDSGATGSPAAGGRVLILSLACFLDASWLREK